MRRKGRRGVPFGSRRPPTQKNSPRRRAPGRQLNPKLQKELKRANHLMRNGEHHNAGQMFQQLAENSQDRGILLPAAMLFMQAATVFMLASDVEDALEQARKGLGLLAEKQRWRPFAKESTGIIRAFEDGGYADEAEQLSSWVNGFPGYQKRAEKKGKASNTKEFPSKCPYCGASLSLEQIKNTRHSVTECKYCGSIVVGEQID